MGLLLSCLLATVLSTPAQDRLALHTLEAEDGSRRSEGTYAVFENRDTGEGRLLHLQVVVLHARSEDPAPDPVFVLAGGPGQNAATLWRGHQDHWMREDRDLVLVSQRGTGGDHRLDGPVSGNDQDLQSYLEPLFDVEVFRRGRDQLARKADLTCYSTPIAMDDLDEVRQALGYEQINLSGGSYGTRAALVFLRRHADVTRTAILDGVAPLSFTNPLFHAAAAQEGLERVFQEVEQDPDLVRQYPDLRGKFDALMARLASGPVTTRVRHPATGTTHTVRLDQKGFAEALRVLLYYTGTNRQVPRLLLQAHDGDFSAFAQAGLERNRGLRRMLAFGMLMCITAAEDLARIDPADIPRRTEHTFLGDTRVRSQMAVGALWPRSRLPEGFGDPVQVAVPVLLMSGTHDPVTPPWCGEEAARHLPHSLHLAVPGCHGVGGHPTLVRIQRQFLEQGSVEGLDLRGLDQVRMPRIAAPAPRGPF